MKIFLDTIGCRLNQSEIEQFAAQFHAAGHEIVDSPAAADWVVVNTCAVTAQAASDSRGKIRAAARATQGKIVVTGCWSAVEPTAALALPQVVRVVDNPLKDRLVADLLQLPPETFDLEPLARERLPGAHLRTRAFIKVQDGCDNHCTFCLTRIARGASRSRTVEAVVRDVEAALHSGTQEVVLTGVQLESWGQDFSAPQHLATLVRALLDLPHLPRLRLSSLEPWDLDDDFFTLWQDTRLCRHLHLPLQSGAQATLHRMVRKTTPDSFARLAQAARAAVPEIALTTDLMVGFPGETQVEFAESLAFVAAIQFAAGHVFRYSTRPGTAAARMNAQVTAADKKARSAQMQDVFSHSAQAYRQQFIGQTLTVLWEATTSYSAKGWHLHGLSDNYLRVTAVSPQKLWNRLTQVRITGEDQDELTGEIIS